MNVFFFVLEKNHSIYAPAVRVWRFTVGMAKMDANVTEADRIGQLANAGEQMVERLRRTAFLPGQTKSLDVRIGIGCADRGGQLLCDRFLRRGLADHAQALEAHKMIRLVPRDFVDWIFMPDEPPTSICSSRVTVPPSCS